jgi:hypothetical protein
MVEKSISQLTPEAREERERVLGVLEELRSFFEANRAWPRLVNMVRHGDEPETKPRKRKRP